MILLPVFSIDAHLSLPLFIAWLSSSSLFPDLCACPAMVTFFPSLSFSFTPSTSSHPSSPLSLPSHTPCLFFFCKLWSLCFFGLSLKPSTCDVNLLLKLQKRKEGKGCDISKKKPQNPRNRSFQAPAGCLINSKQRSMFVRAFVCLFLNSSETTGSYVLKFWGIILHRMQTILGFSQRLAKKFVLQ